MRFFSIYLRRCADSSTGCSIRPMLSAASRGIGAAVLETFPTMAYSKVKDLKIGKGALECAICLNEFEDTKRFHCFRSAIRPETNNITPADQHTQEEIVVTVISDGEEQAASIQEPRKSGIMKRAGSFRSNRPPRSGSVRSKLFGFGNKFSRSHSTGHSLVQLGENVDRYTLRLPEEVRKEIMRRALLTQTANRADNVL